MSEKLRYSDEELEEFKALILEKLAAARKLYQEMLAAMDKRSSNEYDETAPTFHMLSEGSNLNTLQEQYVNADRQLRFIKGLEAALVRIEHKTYGICKVNKTLIPKARLLAVPHTTMSIEAKLAQGK